MIQIKHVKNEYYDNKFQIAQVVIPNGFDYNERKDEIEVIHKIKDEFGGKFELLNEINITGYKNPDFIWESKCWEIKSVSSKNSVDSQVRYALKQIAKEVGGIILILDRCFLSMDEVIDIVFNRVKRTNFHIVSKVDVILMRYLTVIDIIRLIRKDIPSAKEGQR